jgi:murein DD-endopeptidase MepM/ murein hydrolase activator NlpD
MMYPIGNLQSPYLGASSFSPGTNSAFPQVSSNGLPIQRGMPTGTSAQITGMPNLLSADTSMLSGEALTLPQSSNFIPSFVSSNGQPAQVGLQNGQGMVPGMLPYNTGLQGADPQVQQQLIDTLSQLVPLMQQVLGQTGQNGMVVPGAMDSTGTMSMGMPTDPSGMTGLPGLSMAPPANFRDAAHSLMGTNILSGMDNSGLAVPASENLREAAYASSGLGSYNDLAAPGIAVPDPGDMRRNAYSAIGLSVPTGGSMPGISTSGNMRTAAYSAFGLSQPTSGVSVSPETDALPQEGNMVAPLDRYSVTSEFGNRYVGDPRFDGFHNGIDLGAPTGTPVKSVLDGTVTRVGNDPAGYGNWVEVTHNDGSRTRYGHLHGFGNIRKGQNIGAGTVVGTVGSTGNSSGPHLHFEVIDRSGKNVDPRRLLRF